MSEVRVLVTLPVEVWADLKIRCQVKGIKDYRRTAGGFIQDALEGGFFFDDDEDEARYYTLREQEGE